MKVRELRVKYATQQSFGKKAFVKKDDEGTDYLYSYYSLIVTNYGKALKFEENLNLYTNTTLRHVREYLRQIGKWDLADLGKAKILIADEPDNAYALATALMEAGAMIEAVIAQRSEIREAFTCKVEVGDFDDVEAKLHAFDAIISNYHAERLAKKYHKAVMFRGFPNYEQIGIGLKNNVLYEGSCALLCEFANHMVHHESH